MLMFRGDLYTFDEASLLMESYEAIIEGFLKHPDFRLDELVVYPEERVTQGVNLSHGKYPIFLPSKSQALIRYSRFILSKSVGRYNCPSCGGNNRKPTKFPRHPNCSRNFDDIHSNGEANE